VTTADRAGLLELRPAVRPGIQVGPPLSRGPRTVHLVKDPVTGGRWEIGPKERFVIARLDGTRPLAEIGAEYAAAFGARLGEAQWTQLLRLLSVRGLLAGGPPRRPAVPVDEPKPQGGWTGGRTRLVADAEAAVERLHGATAFARNRLVLGLLLALCAALLAAEGVEFATLAHATGRLFHQPVALVGAGCVLWLSLGVHELAHGVVARAFGLRVAEIGLRRVAGFMTYLYCEVEDVRFLGRRGPQVAVACAGVVANLAFLLPFWAVWELLPARAQAVPFVGGLLLLGTAMGLLNLVPLPPLDGYKALGYALGTLRLAAESRAYARLALAAASRRPGAREQAAGYPPRLRRVYAGYAALAALLAACVLAAGCALCRAVLPAGWSDWTPWLPLALVAAAVPLRILGLRAAARRTPASAVPAAAQPSPPPVPAAVAPHHRAPGAALSAREKSEMEPTDRRDRPPGPSTAPAVTAIGVCKSYNGQRALDGVSFTVQQGEFFGILGPNGAGKTTLVEIVEGMREADAGTVEVFGQPTWPRNTALLRRIGVQTQASAFFTRLTAAEHLVTVAALQGLGRDAARRALESVGLAGKARTRVDDLSGGQRQRLALATALVHDPELIFLDEPTAALDPEARRSLWQLLRSLRAQGRTIVYTTHHLDEAEALCDRVAIVAGGRIVALDTPGALVRSLAAPARLLVPADRITPAQARGIEGVDRVLVEGGEVVIETRKPSRVLVAVGQLVDLDAVQTRTATLEDAYLRLTAAGTEQHR
jgi:ABC-type multidrug transport system ATPase subunit/Zn-dependent protease